MEKPYRYRKTLVESGGSKYVLLPASWVKKNLKEGQKDVIVEVYKDRIVVLPVK